MKIQDFWRKNESYANQNRIQFVTISKRPSKMLLRVIVFKNEFVTLLICKIIKKLTGNKL